MQSKGWIGVDLDGTLAEHRDDWHINKDPFDIGAPIPAMVDRVKKWIASGEEVRIVTARVGGEAARTVTGCPCCTLLESQIIARAIQSWTLRHIGVKLKVTAEKDPYMKELWDDRAVQITRNTGQPTCA